MATILQLKVAKKRLFEKVSLERCRIVCCHDYMVQLLIIVIVLKLVIKIHSTSLVLDIQLI